MAPLLSHDILFMVLEHLADDRDFGTLFRCSISCKTLCVPAISYLYRTQDVAPVKSGGTDEPQQPGRDMTAGWANLWRSIILSARGKTVYPYCRYLRVLDFGDLKDLLEDAKFRERYARKFFANELAEYKIQMVVPMWLSGGRTRTVQRFAAKEIVAKIGDLLSEKAPMVEELAGDIGTEELKSWVPRLKNLHQLRLWDGLKIDGIGPLIKENCPHFNGLKFYHQEGTDGDRNLADFLDGLEPNTFSSLEIFSMSQINELSFAALGKHAAALAELKLGRVNSSAFGHITELQKCAEIRSFQIVCDVDPNVESETAQLYSSQLAAWLKSRKKLREVSFASYPQAPAIVAELMLHPDTQLTHLSLTNYDAGTAALGLHAALSNQSHSLKSLLLKGDGDTEADTLVESVSRLQNLKDLRLQGVSDYFKDEQILQIAFNLPQLEELWISGWSITDAIWEGLATLHNLRRLDLYCFSAFKAQAIINFILTLGPGNKGLSLAIMMADPISPLSDEEQTLVKDTLTAQVEGRFDYTLARDPEAIDYDEISDSD